ncbi:hypothetical protein SVAN01_07901 [Stagonosporopsis vannaccii]|nr:hypothetical protein SVAN01_07901 [Stagonosporopsis vannaccii]
MSTVSWRHPCAAFLAHAHTHARTPAHSRPGPLMAQRRWVPAAMSAALFAAAGAPSLAACTLDLKPSRRPWLAVMYITGSYRLGPFAGCMCGPSACALSLADKRSSLLQVICWLEPGLLDTPSDLVVSSMLLAKSPTTRARNAALRPAAGTHPAARRSLESHLALHSVPCPFEPEPCSCASQDPNARLAADNRPPAADCNRGQITHTVRGARGANLNPRCKHTRPPSSRQMDMTRLESTLLSPRRILVTASHAGTTDFCCSFCVTNRVRVEMKYNGASDACLTILHIYLRPPLMPQVLRALQR